MWRMLWGWDGNRGGAATVWSGGEDCGWRGWPDVKLWGAWFLGSFRV